MGNNRGGVGCTPLFDPAVWTWAGGKGESRLAATDAAVKAQRQAVLAAQVPSCDSLATTSAAPLDDDPTKEVLTAKVEEMYRCPADDLEGMVRFVC